MNEEPKLTNCSGSVVENGGGLDHSNTFGPRNWGSRLSVRLRPADAIRGILQLAHLAPIDEKSQNASKWIRRPKPFLRHLITASSECSSAH